MKNYEYWRDQARKCKLQNDRDGAIDYYLMALDDLIGEISAAQLRVNSDSANPWGLDDDEMQEGEWVGDEGDR